jgi:hypothetical protein
VLCRWLDDTLQRSLELGVDLLSRSKELSAFCRLQHDPLSNVSSEPPLIDYTY